MLNSRAISGLLALIALAPAFRAQEEGGGDADAKSDDADAKSGDDEKDAKYLAIVGGDVYTGTGAVLRGATVLARNGKIAEIGYEVWVPEGAEKVDAAGLRVYPGLIALGATTRVTMGTFGASEPEPHELEPELEIMWDGLLPVPVPRDTHLDTSEPHDEDHPPAQADGDESGDEQKSEIEDTFDPFNSYLVLSLATGITTAQQSSAAVKLKRNEIDGVLLSDRRMASIPWDLSNPTGIAGTRKKFERTAVYLREYRAWKARNKKEEKEPSKKGIDTSALRVLSGEALALFRASNREELLGIARFAQEYGFRPVIDGCEEGWTVADELGRAGAYAILTPRNRQAKDESLVRAGGASIENAAKLHAAGVQVAVRAQSTSIDNVGTAGRDLLALPIEAGFAVRGGLSNEAALASMTIVPARMLGIEHRTGTLEVGKDCDAIVTDGDVLHYQTFVQYTVVDGKLVYDKEKEIYFAHIRPRPKKPEAAKAEVKPSESKEEPAAEEKDEEKPADEGAEGGEKKEEGGEKKEEGGEKKDG
jgi:hypothetical protein